MVRIIIIFFIFIYSFNSLGEELSVQEQVFFNFIDLNKDKNISLEEINQSIKLIFQLIDENQDGNISELEIIELKNIIELLS
tara:strand:+ start:225 stop:470 length:246 start_codon:yes stop_codon:yes gene_type:complete